MCCYHLNRVWNRCSVDMKAHEIFKYLLYVQECTFRNGGILHSSDWSWGLHVQRTARSGMVAFCNFPTPYDKQDCKLRVSREQGESGWFHFTALSWLPGKNKYILVQEAKQEICDGQAVVVDVQKVIVWCNWFAFQVHWAQCRLRHVRPVLSWS